MRHPESTTATHVLQQMAAQLSAPPPQLYVRTPPCDIISERRAAFGKSKAFGFPIYLFSFERTVGKLIGV